MIYHMIESHNEYRKVVHRPYSRYISSIQKLNKNSIEFSLSAWTRSGTKLSQLHSYTRTQYSHWHCLS